VDYIADNQYFIPYFNELLTIEVVDISGSVIYNTTLISFDSYSINCSSWKSGVYFVMVSDNKRVLKSKVVKK
jgi:hypothetical protein